MGSLYKRGKVYYANLVVNGKRVRRRIGESKKTAEKVLRDLEAKATRQQFDLDIPDGTLEQVFSEFIEYSKTNNSPSTTRRYKNVIANFEIYLHLHHRQIKKVSQVDLAMIEQYKRFRRDVDPRKIQLPDDLPHRVAPNKLKAKPSTINYELKTLKSIFGFGCKHTLCRANPLDGIRYLKVIEDAEPRFLSADECRRLLEAADSEVHPIFYTFLNTGLRLGELLNLQWGDIDLKRGVFFVKKKSDWQPKAGERQVPLNEGMLKLLQARRPARVKPDAYVFPSKDGARLRTKLRKVLIQTAETAGLVGVTKIHTLRHTFASHLVMSGVDLPTVQKLLGHSDIQTTMIYSHLATEHISTAVNKINLG